MLIHSAPSVPRAKVHIEEVPHSTIATVELTPPPVSTIRPSPQTCRIPGPLLPATARTPRWAQFVALTAGANPEGRPVEAHGVVGSPVLAESEAGFDAVWVVGNAPTALFELLEMDVRPALVVGLPVGFVGAAESKERLIRSGLPAVANHGPKGGSAVAAAALNALLYFEEERIERSSPGG